MYRLAHITLLECINGPTPSSEVGMVEVRMPRTSSNHVVRIADIEGMAHLIPWEPGVRWLVNNRIDLQTWDDMYDGN